MQQRQKSINQVLEQRKTNNEQLEYKRQELVKEGLEELKIADFEEKKYATMEMRKNREAFRFQEKQKQKQRMIDEQVRLLNSIRLKEDKRMERQQEEI